MQYLKLDPNDSVLIVAPHADDEIIGTGGLIVKYASQCDVLLLSDGRRGRRKDSSRTENETAEMRKDEFRRVMVEAGVRSFRSLAIPDHKVRWNMLRIFRTSFERKYSFVFIPNRFDGHKDHRAAYKAFYLMTRFWFPRPVLCEYEVWNPLRKPNLLLDISDCYERKHELLMGYPSQLECMDYDGMMYGINRYRGACANKRMCEAYRIHSGPLSICKEKMLKEINRHRRKRNNLL